MFWEKKKAKSADKPDVLIAEEPVAYELMPRYIDANSLPYHIGYFESGNYIVYALSSDIDKAPELKIDENTSDGTMFDNMFIVGIDTPDGQATYHYDNDPYWNMFNVRELDRAPEYDGHTPDDAIRRIGNLPAWTPPVSADTLNTIITPYTITCQDFETPDAYYYESDPE